MADNTRPTLKSIAAVAGVSPMTVSLALRNSPRISADTRGRIQELAGRLGYQPNSFATSLVSFRAFATKRYRGTLALLNCNTTQNGWQSSPTFCRYFKGANQRAAELGYTLDEFWFADPALNVDRLRRALESRGIHGLIFAFYDGKPGLQEKLRAFDFSRFASATISRRIADLAVHSISNDQYHAATLTTDKVLSLGYRRLGLVLDAHVDAGLEHRFRGGFLTRQNSVPKSDWVPVLEMPETKPRILKNWIEQHRVDAIIAFPHNIHQHLQEIGISVPDEIGLAHLDRPTPHHNLAGVDQNSEQVGSAAVDVVIAQIHRNEHGIPPYQKSLFIRGEWVEGWSVRAQKSAAALAESRLA